MAGILGSFDPNLKQEQLAKYQVKFGVDGVHLIQRSKFFLFVKIIIPLILYILLYTVTMIGVGYFSASDPQVIGYSAIIGLLFVLILFLTLNFKRLLDYLMDFILITPDQIIAFNQKGIWKRSNISIETIKIKSISVSYRSWIFSLFNNGDITFLSEGDSNNGGEIQAFYVYQPQKIKERIYEIMNTADSHTHPAVND